MTASPPTFVSRIGEFEGQPFDLPEPIAISDGMKSALKRELALAFAASGGTPGTFVGEQLKRLDNDLLAPSALEVLQDRLARYDWREIVEFGLDQISRCIDRSAAAARNIRESATVLTLGWDPVAQFNELADSYLNIRLSVEMCVEAALRLGLEGDSPLDPISWMDLLAAADAYFGTTVRSEMINYQLSPVSLTVTEYYEFDIHRATIEEATKSNAVRRVYDFDRQTFSSALSLLQISDQYSQYARRFDKALADSVDVAFQSSFGVKATEIVVACATLAQWPIAEPIPAIAIASRSEIHEHVRSQCSVFDDEDGASRIDAALKWLTINTSELKSERWEPWLLRTRRNRLLARPIVALDEDTYVISPQLCLASGKRFFAYLEQGILPWSTPRPPRAVDAALADYRSIQNKELERHVSSLLTNSGYRVVDRIKRTDPQRLGLKHLSGEVDIVAAKEGDPNVWLIEVKDPSDVYASAEIRRSLDRFYMDGKRRCYVYTWRTKRTTYWLTSAR